MSFRSLGVILGLAMVAGAVDASPPADAVRLETPPGSTACTALSFSPDGKTLAGAFGVGSSGEIVDGKAKATETYGGDLLLWDAVTGRLRRTLGKHDGGATWVRFSRSGHRLASASERDGSFRLWDTQAGREVFRLEAGSLPGALHGMLPFPVVDPELRSLVTVESRVTLGKNWRYDEPRTLSVWDAATGHLRWKLANSDVYRAAFSPDGETLAASVYHTTWTRNGVGEPQGDVHEPRLLFWSARTGKRLLTIPLTERAEQIRYLPDGRTLAVLSAKGTNLWDSRTGTIHPAPLSLPSPLPSRVRFSPDGGRLGVAYVDYTKAPFRYTADILSVITGKPLAGLSRTDLDFAGGQACDLSPDLSRLACLWDRAPVVFTLPRRP